MKKNFIVLILVLIFFMGAGLLHLNKTVIVQPDTEQIERSENKTVKTSPSQREDHLIYGTVYNSNQRPVKSAVISWKSNDHSGTIRCQDNGYYELEIPENITNHLEFKITQKGYREKSVLLDQLSQMQYPFKLDIELSNTGILSGTVINKETKQPVANCSIALKPVLEWENIDSYFEYISTKIPTLLTDINGYFYIDLSLDFKSEDSYQLYLKADGFIKRCMQIQYPEQSQLQIELSPGNNRMLTGYTVIRGTQTPIGGIQVEIMKPVDSIGIGMTIAQVTTDSNGMFSLALPDDKYRIYGKKSGYQSLIPIKYRFFPGESELPLTIEVEKTYNISGYVLEKDTEIPLSGVTIYSENGFSILKTSTDERGFYTFQEYLAPEFQIDVVYPNYFISENIEESIRLSQENLNGYDVTDHNIYLEKGITVSGNIKNTVGQPIENAKVFGHGAQVKDGFSNSDGSFCVYVKPNQLCQLRVFADDYQACNSNSIQIKEENIDHLKIIMHPTISISGKVLDIEGKPLPFAEIQCGGYFFSYQKIGTADKHGHFKIPDLHAQQISLRALNTSTKQYSNVIKFNVKHEHITDQIIQIEPSKTISGYIHNSDGDAIEGATIRTQPFMLRTPELQSDHQGYFSFEGVSDKKYTVQISHANYQLKTLTDINATSKPLNISLKRAKTTSVKLNVIDKYTKNPVTSYTFYTARYRTSSKKETVFNHSGPYILEKPLLLPFLITVESDNYLSKTVTRYKEVSVLTIELAPNVTVTGHIIDDISSTPVFNAKISLPQRNGINCSSYSDQQGYFEMENCPPGNTAMSISHANYSKEIKSVNIANEKYYNAGDFRLKQEGFAITGTIIDQNNRPLKHIHISLMKMNENIAHAKSDHEGKFIFRRLQPGEYQLKYQLKHENSRDVSITERDLEITLKMDTNKKQENNDQFVY